MNYFKSNPCYDSNYSGFDQIELPQYSVNPFLNIQNEPSDHELFISKLIQQKLQNEYAQPFSAIAITFDLPTMEPVDSLRMGDEILDTIPKTKSDEFIKYSVENLVPNPSESEDLFDSECDVPACDDFTTFSNLLFDADDDFSSKSLLNHDSSIISSSSSKIDSLLDEFAGEVVLLKSISLGIDKTDCDPEEEIRLIEKLLYDNSSPSPPKEFISKNSDAAIESFSPSPIPVEDSDSFMKEFDLSFTLDDPMPPSIEEDDYDSEIDMLIFEELLSNDSLSLPENESFHFYIPSFSRPPAKPPDDDSGILSVKMVGDISEQNVPMPRLLPTQPTHILNQEKSPNLLSHKGFKASQLHSRLIEKLLYDNSSPSPPKEFISKNSDAAIESFSPSPIPVEDSDSFMKEFDLSFTLDDPMPPSIEEDDYDSEIDMLIFEELLSNDSLSLPENDSSMGDWVKLSDPKQALRGRHPMLILV
nr:hypothetical protein [Tanacetum cinerariifolium]